MRQFAEKWANFAKNEGKNWENIIAMNNFRNEYFILHTHITTFCIYVLSRAAVLRRTPSHICLPLPLGKQERSEYCEENVTFV